MPIEIQVHSTAKRAITIIVFAVVLSVVFLGARKLTGERSKYESPSQEVQFAKSTIYAQVMIPVIDLPVADASKELNWSASLAKFLDGTTEVAVPNGRVDVLTKASAIEVDRLEKWHEGIGQAAHYGTETGEQPCLALIIASDLWPLSVETIEKLRTIDRTALKQGIKLIILRRASPET